MSGFVAMHRGWQDHPIFAGEEYSRRDAWAWLIAHAAWKPTKIRIKGSPVDLERGELCFSQRFLAEKWCWSKSRVDRFITCLRAEGMIATRSKIGATADHPAGQGQSILTICNYDKFQSLLKTDRGNDEPTGGATPGQQRGKEEEGNKEIRKEGRGPYAFEGQTVRLNQVDFDTWKRRYHHIPDLRAELSSIDDWWQDKPEEKRAKWFHSTMGMLNRKHQEMATSRRSERWPGSDFVDEVLKAHADRQAREGG